MRARPWLCWRPGRQSCAAWRKPSFCQSGECVEVAELNGMIVIRDSKDLRGRMLHYTMEEWQAFIRGIKAGEYDDLER
jgi:hypothetical protein